MQNELENILKNKMSLNVLDIDQPSEDLVAKARKKIARRKVVSTQNETLLEGIKSFFYAELKVYQVVLFTLVIAGCYFWFSKPQEDPSNRAKIDNYMVNEKAITSSTILASNNHKEMGEPSANTSTALASIKTFISRN